jgi:hypothetical protein
MFFPFILFVLICKIICVFVYSSHHTFALKIIPFRCLPLLGTRSRNLLLKFFIGRIASSVLHCRTTVTGHSCPPSGRSNLTRSDNSCTSLWLL